MCLEGTGLMTNRWLDGLTVSEETSLSLLARAQRGDAVAMEALMGRYLARLQRWATGRVPTRARSLLDTDDVVQDALLNTFRRLEDFQPRHDGVRLAYLREAVANRIRMELRRRSPDIDGSVELDGLPSLLPSPLESAVRRDALDRYEQSLAQLDDEDRAAIIGPPYSLAFEGGPGGAGCALVWLEISFPFAPSPSGLPSPPSP